MYNMVCNTNTTTNANEIKALTRVESEIFHEPNPFVPNFHRLKPFLCRGFENDYYCKKSYVLY